MRFGSVCSGIGAPEVAWSGLGWAPVFCSEIEKAPSAVLAHRFPSTPNLGDFTKIGAEHGPVDLLVGGTPCQSFSVAGRRLGMDDPRGHLALEYLSLARRVGARWIVWENVPGVLSCNGGRDFGAFLRAVGECGYGWAYRILDAQFFGVPQRRRRVFVVGYLGDWRRAGAVLCDATFGQRDTSPRQETADSLGTLTTRCCVSKDNHSAEDGFIVERGGRASWLTPRECERLQGFPDDWTLVPNGRGGMMADGPRYKMIGNSMAVPVMKWIGERIKAVDAI